MDNKPITLVREEFMNNLGILITQSGLPLFIVEDAMRQILNGVSELARKQLEQDKQIYIQNLSKSSQVEKNKNE